MTTPHRRSRSLTAALSALLVASIAACSSASVGNQYSGSDLSGDESEPSQASSPSQVPSPAPSAAESSVSRLTAALPDPSDLPADSTVEYCPGADTCPSWSDDQQSVGLRADDGEASGGRWYTPRLRLDLTRYADASGAVEAFGAFEEFAAQRDGEFSIGPGTSDDGDVRTGEQGSGTVDRVALGEWVGSALAAVASYSNQDGEVSAPQASAHVVLQAETVVLRCSAWIDGADVTEAQQKCTDLVDTTVVALDDLPADAGALVTAPEHLVEALPSLEAFPAGAEIQLRCPDDPDCATLQDPVDARLSLAYPDEGDAAGIKGDVEPTRAAAAKRLEDARSSAIGEVRVEPGDDGPAGRAGTADLEETSIGAWHGVTHVFEGTTWVETPTGTKEWEPRFIVEQTVVRDRVVVSVRVVCRVEAWSRQDAVAEVGRLLEPYLAEIDRAAQATTHT